MSYRELFEEFDTNGIFCVSWKNNHLLESSYKGERDLDLFVSKNRKELVLTILSSYGFKRFYQPGIEVRDVEHYYCFDYGLDSMLHLQVYFKLNTGNSMVKEYQIDNTIMNLDNCIIYSKGLYVPTAKLQLKLYQLRDELKKKTRTGRILLEKEAIDYENEYADIISRLDNEKYDDIQIDDISFRRRFLKSTIFVLEIWNVVIRFIKKGFKINKKRPKRGLVLGITGSDGSGKSTLVKKLADSLSKNFRVKTIHIGRPITISSNFGNTKKSGLIFVVKSLILAIARFLKSYEALLYKMLGFIVVVDRCLGTTQGAPDSPRILPEQNWLPSYVERVLYKWSYKFNVVYFLNVSLSNALLRNSQRTKVGKETDLEIEIRHEKTSDLQPVAIEVIDIDANLSATAVFREVLDDIWGRV